MNAPVLEVVLTLVVMLLLVTILLGLIRIWRGPKLADRMLTAQLFGTTGIALLLVLSELEGIAALRNAALIVALLAVLSSVAFVSRGRHSVPADLEQPLPEDKPGDKDAGGAAP